MIIDSTIDKITLKLQTGKTPPSKEEKYFDGGLNWYTPSDLNKKLLTSSRRTVTELAYKDKKATLYPKGTVLLSCIGDIGKLGIITDDTSSSNQQITGLIPDTTKITSEYLYYLCLEHKKVFEDKATKVVIPMLNNKRLRKVKISYEDDKNEQIKIANLLSQVELLIGKREESIALLDELLESTFLDMFGDPVLNTKGWEKVPLSQLGEINRGISKHRPRNAPELLGGKYPLIQTGDVSNADLYIEKFTQTYSDIGLAQSKLWQKDTLCITIAANIAKTAILKFDACFPDSIVGMEIDEEKTNLFYIHFLFKFFQKLLEKNAPQAAQKNINLQILRNLKVPKPDKDLQDKFATIVEQVEESKGMYQESLNELRDLFGSLSQRAFKGELDLSGLELDNPQITSIKINGKEVNLLKNSTNNLTTIESITKSIHPFPKMEGWDNIRDSIKAYESMLTPSLSISSSFLEASKFAESLTETINPSISRIKEIGNHLKIEQEKIHQLSGLAKYNDSISNFTKEYKSLFQPSLSTYESIIKDASKNINELKLSSIDSLGLDALSKTFEVNQPYKIALKQLESMNSLRSWGETHNALVNQYQTQVEKTTEIIESISNLSDLIYDELFDDIFWTDSYDDIKVLVFKLIDEGKLKQEFDGEKMILIKVDT